MTNRICGSCDFENTGEALYCGSCGKQLGNICKNCGFSNYGTSICSNCGRVISSALITEEFTWRPTDSEPGQTEPINQTSEVPENDPSLPRPGEIGTLFSTSINAYRANFLPFLALALISSVPATIFLSQGDGLIAYFTDFMGDDSVNSPNSDEPNWVLLIPLMLLAVFGEIISTASIIFGSAQHMNGEKVNVATCISYSFSSFFRLTGVMLVFVVVLILPTILSIFFIGIPILIFLIVKLWFVICFVMVENTGIITAVKRSWSLVESKWWITFGTGAVVIIITALARATLSYVAVQLGSLLDNIAFSHALRGLTTTLIAPFQAISTGIYFLGLRKSKGPDS